MARACACFLNEVCDIIWVLTGPQELLDELRPFWKDHNNNNNNNNEFDSLISLPTTLICGSGNHGPHRWGRT